MLTFRDSNKSFELDRDLLETKTNYDFNVSHSNRKDQKLIYEFGKEMIFNIKQKGRKSNRDKSMTKLLISPALMASAFSILNLSSDPDELCHRRKLLFREKYAGNNSDIINREIVVIVDKLLEYKCVTKKQHDQILSKCSFLHD